MNIVIDNREFNYDLGCRLLKTKYKEEVFPGLRIVTGKQIGRAHV